MKILLIGEYSGLHRNLAYGLRSQGHYVEVAAYRDGWKQMPVDFDFGPQGRGVSSIIGRIKNIASHVAFNKYAEKFDVLQFINPVIFPIIFGYNDVIIKRLLKLNVPKVLVAAGDDAFTWRISRKKMRYHPWDAWVSEDLKLKNPDEVYWASDRMNKWCSYFVNNVDAVIPVMYEYDIAYASAKNKSPVIPLPVITDEISYSENKIHGKIKIFHGLNRPGFKGTSLVSNAFEILNRKYNGRAEFIIDGKMPYEKYIQFMKTVNLVVDQVRSYSHGLNGLIAMAAGKVVLGGVEPESLIYYENKNSPAINLLPSIGDIVLKISKLLDSDFDINQLGKLSRDFVIENHDAVKISKLYMSVYRGIDN